MSMIIKIYFIIVFLVHSLVRGRSIKSSEKDDYDYTLDIYKNKSSTNSGVKFFENKLDQIINILTIKKEERLQAVNSEKKSVEWIKNAKIFYHLLEFIDKADFLRQKTAALAQIHNKKNLQKENDSSYEFDTDDKILLYEYFLNDFKCQNGKEIECLFKYLGFKVGKVKYFHLSDTKSELELEIESKSQFLNEKIDCIAIFKKIPSNFISRIINLIDKSPETYVLLKDNYKTITATKSFLLTKDIIKNKYELDYLENNNRLFDYSSYFLHIKSESMLYLATLDNLLKELIFTINPLSATINQILNHKSLILTDNIIKLLNKIENHNNPYPDFREFKEISILKQSIIDNIRNSKTNAFINKINVDINNLKSIIMEELMNFAKKADSLLDFISKENKLYEAEFELV